MLNTNTNNNATANNHLMYVVPVMG